MVPRGTVIVAVGVLVSACSLLVSLDDLKGSGVADSAASDAAVESAVDAPIHTIAFVQAVADYYSNTGLTFASSVVDGNAVIVVVANSVPGAVAVSDEKGNSYATIIGPYAASDGGTLSLFVTFGVTGGFTNIHVSAPDGGTGYIYYAAEYSGITTLDGTGTGNTQSLGTDALVTSSVSTTADPELVFGYAEGLGNVDPGTNFTARSLFDGNTIEERIVTTPGAYQATATLLGGTGDIMVACFH
jgi:hypothetical protein